MFGIDLNPVSLITTAMFGPAGGLIAQLAQQVVSQFGQQLLGQIGQGMGLPQSAIDLAQSSYSAANGDMQGTASNLMDAVDQLGQASGASPAEIGDAQNAIQKLLNQQANDAIESDEAKEAKAGGKGGGWLRALARALGEAADKTAKKLEQDAKKLDNATPSQSAEYAADAQAFSMLMNSINTAIKAIGEALSSIARKQ